MSANQKTVIWITYNLLFHILYLCYRFSHLKLSNESIEKLMLILPEMSSLHLLK